MIYRVYGLLDKVTAEEQGVQEFEQLMLLKGEKEVKATYMDFMKRDPNSPLTVYASDYDIYQLAIINTVKGESRQDIKQVCNLSCLLPRTNDVKLS